MVREWSLFTTGGGKGGEVRDIEFECKQLGDGGNFNARFQRRVGRQYLSAQTSESAISKRLKTMAKIFATGAALVSRHNISIFPKDFPFS